MLTLNDLGYYELESEEDKHKLLLAYIQHILDLDLMLAQKEFGYCTTIEDAKKIYKSHTDKNSILSQILKGLSQK